MYLIVLIAAARLAATPASADIEMCDSAYVSGTVTFQASGFPLARGIMVTPSGLLTLERRILLVLMCRNLRFLMDLQMMSFSMA